MNSVYYNKSCSILIPVGWYQLVSDSVKMKQTHSSLISEKQALAKQLQQVHGSMELLKMKVARSEEQVSVLSICFSLKL